MTDQESNGVALIAAERARQVSAEGWTPEHDDEHDGELAMAASVYAQPQDLRLYCGRNETPIGYPRMWEFKPTPNDRIRELVKAGALIAAEIDRLTRKRND